MGYIGPYVYIVEDIVWAHVRAISRVYHELINDLVQ
jgi:hypothetical protein